LRVGESGARIAPEPIDTRKKKESRATIDRTLSAMQCPTLLAFFRKSPRPQAAVDFIENGNGGAGVSGDVTVGSYRYMAIAEALCRYRTADSRRLDSFLRTA